MHRIHKLIFLFRPLNELFFSIFLWLGLVILGYLPYFSDHKKHLNFMVKIYNYGKNTFYSRSIYIGIPLRIFIFTNSSAVRIFIFTIKAFKQYIFAGGGSKCLPAALLPCFRILHKVKFKCDTVWKSLVYMWHWDET